jgi:hypothetical protein
MIMAGGGVLSHRRLATLPPPGRELCRRGANTADERAALPAALRGP